MTDSKIKVLYIGGWGRSGSTILGSVLGSIEGVYHIGELPYLWDISFLENRPCGCQSSFSECAFWTDVLDHAYGGREGVDPRRMIELRNRGPQNRSIPGLLLTGNSDARRQFDPEYLDNLSRLYEAVHRVTNCRVIVDSSKFPAYAYAVQSLPTVDFHLLHLVRDARANAYSWLKKRNRGDAARDLGQFEAQSSSTKWVAWNATFELLGRRDPRKYRRLLYEDFAMAPAAATSRILEFLDEDAELPFSDERTADIRLSHTPWGNPVRSKVGKVEIRADEEWRANMRAIERWKVSAFAWPLLLRYGYYFRRTKGVPSASPTTAPLNRDISR